MVVIVALVVLPGHRVAALIAGLSAGVWFDFFLTKPYERFSIQRGADVQTTVLLALVAVLVGEIAVRRRQARAATRHRPRRSPQPLRGGGDAGRREQSGAGRAAGGRGAA